MAGLAGKTRVTLGITHQAVLAGLIDWEMPHHPGPRHKALHGSRHNEEHRRTASSRVRGCGLIRNRGSSGSALRERERSDLHRGLADRGTTFISPSSSLLTIGPLPCSAMTAMSGTVRCFAQVARICDFSGVSWPFCQAQPSDPSSLPGSSCRPRSLCNLFERLVAQRGSFLLESLRDVVALVEFSRELVVAVGAPQALAILTAANL